MSSLAGVRETESHGPPKGEGRGWGWGTRQPQSLIPPGGLARHCSPPVLAFGILGGRPAPALHPRRLLGGARGLSSRPQGPDGRGSKSAGGLSVHVVHAEGKAGCSYFGELVQRYTRGVERAWGWLRPQWGLGGWTGGETRAPLWHLGGGRDVQGPRACSSPLGRCPCRT